MYRNERSSLSSFDFLAEDASTFIVGHWDGSISLVDRRTPGASYEKLISSSLRKIRTVHVHPVQRQYFITAGLRYVFHNILWFKPFNMRNNVLVWLLDIWLLWYPQPNNFPFYTDKFFLECDFFFFKWEILLDLINSESIETNTQFCFPWHHIHLLLVFWEENL